MTLRALVMYCTFALAAWFMPTVAAQPVGNDLRSILTYCSNWKSLPKDSLGKYSRLAVRLGESAGDQASLPEAYYYLGLHYRQSGLFDSALYAFDRVKQHAGRSRDEAGFTNKADLVRGTIMIQQNQHKEAIEWFYQLLARKENAVNTLNHLTILNGIGWANMELQRFEEAKRWFQRATGNPRYQDESSIVVTYNNLAATFGALQELDSCELYLQKALALSDKHHILASKANTLNIYGDMLIAEKRYDEAEARIREAMQIRKQISDPFYIVSDMAQLAGLYALKKEYPKGIQLAEEALAIARKENMDAKYAMIYQSLYDNYYGAGDYRKSADVMASLMYLKDSLNNKASSRSLAEMEIKYETAKKEQQIQQQHFELVKKNYWLAGSVTLFVLLGLLFYYIYTGFRQKQRQAMQQAIIREQDEAARAVIAAEENERSRMSQTLHDSVGQTLSALKMNLQVLGDAVPQNNPAGTVYRNTLNLTEESIREIRSISHQIIPGNVLRMGLANAVQSLTEKISHGWIQVSLHLDPALSALPADIQLMVYRILQESVNNVIKHADASELSISLNMAGNRLSAAISDNGKGFDTASQMGNGIGLENIATRVRFLKGHYTINSSPGKGTTLIFEIPIDSQ